MNVYKLSNVIKKSVVKILSQDIEYNFKFPGQIKATEPSMGSGFFIDRNGHILTCAHCIQDAKNVYIELMSGVKYKCKIISFSPDYDIALLKINYKNKHFLKMRKKISIGMPVYCLGFPNNTETIVITKGIISAFTGTSIQTDSAINPGNSGGPLMYNNKVIGINSAKMPAYISENTGFAIPIRMIDNFKKLMNTQLIIRSPFIGVGYNSINETITTLMKTKCNGVYINKVYKNSPMEYAGVRTGDILTKINKNKITNLGFIRDGEDSKLTLTEYYSFLELNKKFEIEYMSNGIKKKTLLNNTQYNNNIVTVFPLHEKVKYIALDGGLIMIECSLNLLSDIPSLYNKIDDIIFQNNKRVVIVNIIPNSIIYNLQIFEEGDLIKTVNDININDINHMENIIKKSNGIIKIVTDYDKTCFIKIKNEVKTRNFQKNTVVKLIS
tara:strand:+ start:6804 stop:8123 length:1320 start_codon:yes stop_codon:yes gene_type:complete